MAVSRSRPTGERHELEPLFPDRQPYQYTVDTPRNRKFVQAFRAKFGRDPGSPAAFTYAAMAALDGAVSRGAPRAGPGPHGAQPPRIRAGAPLGPATPPDPPSGLGGLTRAL